MTSSYGALHAHRDRFSIHRLCWVLVSDHGNDHAWVRIQEVRARRRNDDREPTQWIMGIHTARPVYGAARIIRELRRQGVEVGRRRLARLVWEQGIAGITRRRRRNLTKPDKDAAVVPDLIRRRFTAPMPGLKQVRDISFFRADKAGCISRPCWICAARS